MSKEISDEEVEQIIEDSVKVYKTPSSPAVPGLKDKKYKCTSCGKIVEASGDELPEHCGSKMEIYYE